MAESTGWTRWGGGSPLPSCARSPGLPRARRRLLRHPACLEARGAGVGPAAFSFRSPEKQTQRCASSPASGRASSP